MPGYDTNVSNFAAGFLDVGTDLRFLAGYDSTSMDSQSTDQGIWPEAVMHDWTLPLRADGSSPWVGIAASGVYLSHTLVQAANTSGWTVTQPAIGSGRVPGYAWGDSVTTNCAMPGMEFSIATGAARTAYVANSAGMAAVITPKIHIEPSSPYVDVYGGNGFTGKECMGRFIVLKNTAAPDDMRVQGLRMTDANSSISANTTAYVGSPVTCTMNGSSAVAAFDVDCGSGVGLPSVGLLNPAVPTGATTLRIFQLATRICRSSSVVPIAGAAMAIIATSGHSIGQFVACLGTSGSIPTSTPSSPDPYFSATNAQELIKQMCGIGAGNQMPTHVLVFTGKNFASDEQTQLAAGTQTLYRDRHIAVVTALNTFADNLSSPRPKVCFVYSEAHRHGYTATHVATAQAAVQAAAQSTGASMVDLLVRTNVGNVTSWASYVSSYGGITVAATTTGAGAGPVASSKDYLHPSKGGARFVMRMLYEVFCNSLGYTGQSNLLGKPARVAQSSIRRVAGSAG
jgi:hypothetical protein